METKRAEILSVEHLTKSFGKLKVLSDISFSICKGELIAILGPSGCGKTTLLRAIAGLIPFDSGHVRLNGREASERESGGIGMVFQEPRLLPWRTVSGNLRLPFELEGDTSSADSAVKEILELVGLAEFAAAYPHELSGGMRSRAALARALSPNPGLLLMDEPLTGLDIRTREELQDEIIRIWVKKQMSLVWVTHAPEEAVYLADRVIVLTRRPTTVKEVICIGLGHPRDRRNPALQGFSGDIRRLFE